MPKKEEEVMTVIQVGMSVKLQVGTTFKLQILKYAQYFKVSNTEPASGLHTASSAKSSLVVHELVSHAGVLLVSPVI